MRVTHPSDAELALRAQAGDHDALNQLVDRHSKAVYEQVHRLKLPIGVCFDDIAQMGLIALWNAAKKWSPDRGVKFMTYAWVAVKNSIFRAVGEEKKKLARQPVQVDEEGDDTLDIVPAREPVEPPEGLHKWLAQLHVVQRLVLERTYGLHGLPERPSDIGESLGLSIHQVKLACKRAVDL